MIHVVQRAAAIGLAACVISSLLPQSAAEQADRQRAVADAYRASGLDLFRQFSAAPGNIVFSPYSIGTAMAMVLSGARGDTEREMSSVLKHSLGRAEIDRANAEIIATLNGYDKSAEPPACPRGMTLKGEKCECPAPRPGERCVPGNAIRPASAKLLTANALMLTKHGGLISDGYAALLKDKYAAELFRNATLADVNGWASRKTEGKIEKLLEKLDPESAAVLLNAVYFKSRWQTPFDERMTRNESFSLSAAQKIQWRMMRQTGRYALTARSGYRALRIPYAVPNIGMVVVLPDRIDGLADVSRRIDAAELSAIFAALRTATKRVDLMLPRFKTEYKADLKANFQQAGLKLAFDDRRADFSGMTGRPVPPVELVISQIVHRAVIDVSEESTEAAAVTAVEMARVASAPARPDQPEPFTVDRPFLFYIVDDATGLVLFQGRVTDPRQTMVAAR